MHAACTYTYYVWLTVFCVRFVCSTSTVANANCLSPFPLYVCDGDLLTSICLTCIIKYLNVTSVGCKYRWPSHLRSVEGSKKCLTFLCLVGRPILEVWCYRIYLKFVDILNMIMSFDDIGWWWKWAKLVSTTVEWIFFKLESVIEATPTQIPQDQSKAKLSDVVKLLRSLSTVPLPIRLLIGIRRY